MEVKGCIRKISQKLLLAVGVLTLLLVGTTLTASASINQKQTAATTSTATVSWNAVPDAAYYEFTYWNYKYGKEKTGAKTIRVNTNSYNLACPKDTCYFCSVEAYSSAGEIIDWSGLYQPCSAVPGKITGFEAVDWGTDKKLTKGAKFSLQKNPYPNTLNGIEWRLLSRDGKRVLYQGTTNEILIDAPNASLEQVYLLSVRGFTVINEEKFYGEWFSKVVVPQPRLLKTKNASTASKYKIKIRWKKVSGATGYIIYGKTGKSKNYERIATVKKSKSSYTVSKVMGRKIKTKKKYDFKVQAVYGNYKSIMPNNTSGRLTIVKK